MHRKICLLLTSILIGVSVSAQTILEHTRRSLASPDGKHQFHFYQKQQADGTLDLYYRVQYDGKPVVLESKLNIQLDNHIWERALAKFWDQPKEWEDILLFEKSEQYAVNESWSPLYGERSVVKDHYNGMTLFLARNDASQYKMNIEIRAYNEGIAFRYYFPTHPEAIYHKVTEENTEFAFPEGTTAWWTQWAQAPYYEKPLKDWEDMSERPLTLKLADDLYACVTEARQVDFARAMFKLSAKKENTVQVALYSVSDMVTPFGTPWRVIMASDRLGGLLENNDIILNLNEANKIADSQWIRPGKIMRETTLTTKNAKACIDFCAKHNMQYILFDWKWYGPSTEFDTDAGQVMVPELDMPEVVAYGKSKGVGVWVYVNQHALQYQADKIFPIYKEWGLAGVKFGFVQYQTQGWSTWVHDLVRKAADNNLMVNIHDEYRPNGFSRTYPNLLTQEGIRGNEEFPDATHNTILPFTRMIAGAADYTVCYFDPRIKNTHAHQLAFPVIYYSPLQTLYWYDTPARIEEVPELEFFDNVPVSFDDTKVIHDKIGEYVTIARRKGEEWFIGTIGNNEIQRLATPLHFLEPGKSYVARIYTDDEKVNTSTKVKVTTLIVNSETQLQFQLQERGGCALHLSPATQKDLKKYKSYKKKQVL
ncbi:alpha-glucosidase [Parabacteroides sp. PFB2-12]|uniref:glycoside hydrolase family 97 protein n=1 Tax=unclassified Parabacteroides TaxID=2649774 RepID=UPI0024760E40|nr:MULTISPECIES: glycoside hydrolase family 97 protein [unclassified Parabacteroides]MDH6342639.1 alpha-glucosidase [Parabacteroides sp. PM6-13]MDH6391768.1 alpha-glucosidase [Parabacteroides sp. PFB2-12]